MLRLKRPGMNHRRRVRVRTALLFFISRGITHLMEHQVNRVRIRMMELPPDLILTLSLQQRIWFIAINPSNILKSSEHPPCSRRSAGRQQPLTHRRRGRRRRGSLCVCGRTRLSAVYAESPPWPPPNVGHVCVRLAGFVRVGRWLF